MSGDILLRVCSHCIFWTSEWWYPVTYYTLRVGLVYAPLCHYSVLQRWNENTAYGDTILQSVPQQSHIHYHPVAEVPINNLQASFLVRQKVWTGNGSACVRISCPMNLANTSSSLFSRFSSCEDVATCFLRFVDFNASGRSAPQFLLTSLSEFQPLTQPPVPAANK